MALEGIGLSIGLTGTPKEYTSLYKYRQQLDAAKRKASDDKIDDIVSQISVKYGDKLHKLEAEPMRIRTGKFINEALRLKQSQDMQGFYQAVADYETDLLQARNRSKTFFELQEMKREAAAGNKYLFKNQKQAADLILKSASTADYIQALKANGIQRNMLFDYADDGSIEFMTVDKYDLNKAAKNLIDGNKIVIGKTEYPDPAKPGGIIREVAYGIPETEEEAKYLATLKDAAGNPITPKVTVPGVAKTLLENPAVAAQFIDEYNLEGKTPEEIEKEFIDKIVRPNNKIKEGVVKFSPPSSTTINVNTEKQKSYTFSGAQTSVNVAATNDKGGIANSVDSPYAIPFGSVKDISFRVLPSKSWVTAGTGKQMGSTSSSEIKLNYVSVLPYIEEGGVKRVATKGASSNQFGKVQYAPFAFGKLMRIGAEQEVTNTDYYRELSGDLETGFVNSVTDKAGREAMQKSISRLRNAVRKANASGTEAPFNELINQGL